MRPTADQQLAIEAMLNNLLGAQNYDRLCLGMKVGGMDEDVLYVFVSDESCAAEIESDHSDDFAVAAQHVLNRPVRCVNVVPLDFSSISVPQPDAGPMARELATRSPLRPAVASLTRL